MTIITTTTADGTYDGIRQGSTQHKSQLFQSMAALDRPLTPTSSLSSQLNINGDRKAVSQPRNSVSLRLYKVLSTNFDDEDTRQALGTLSELYATPKSKDALVVVGSR
jgi:hypothetical protein